MKRRQSNQLLDELKKIREAVDLLRDRTRNDSFMLVHQSQEIQTLKGELSYTSSKIKDLRRNLFVRLGDGLYNLVIQNRRAFEYGGIVLLAIMFYILGRIM